MFDGKIIQLAEKENKQLSKLAKLHEEEFELAQEYINLYWHFIDEFNLEKKSDVFGRFYNSIRRHLIISLISFLRKHSVVANQTLRYVLEWSVLASYSFEYPDIEAFAETNTGILVNKINKTNYRNNVIYQWFENKYPSDNDFIVEIKKRMNDTYTHANLILTFLNEPLEDTNLDNFYFDNTSGLKTKAQLITIAQLASHILGMFYRMNEEYNIFKVQETFPLNYSRLNKTKLNPVLEMMKLK